MNLILRLETLEQRTIPFQEFELKYRFTEKSFNVIPSNHLVKIKPLDEVACEILGNYLFEESGLIKNHEFNREHFDSIREFDLRTKTEEEVNKWLDNLKIEVAETVFLYWNSCGSVQTKWEIFKMYYDDFYYPGSDDLIIINNDQEWILYFSHYEVVYFGVKK